MGQAKNKKGRSNLSFPEQIQSAASDTVNKAQFLIDNQVARWMEMELDGGIKVICLVFPTTMWELLDNRLTLKGS